MAKDDFTTTEESLYPRDGSEYNVAEDAAQYYDQPLEQAEDDQKMLTTQQASFPIMADVVDWFDSEIAALDSRRRILEYAEAYKLDVNDAGRAFDVARDILIAKLIEFENYRRER